MIRRIYLTLIIFIMIFFSGCIGGDNTQKPEQEKLPPYILKHYKPKYYAYRFLSTNANYLVAVTGANDHIEILDPANDFTKIGSINMDDFGSDVTGFSIVNGLAYVKQNTNTFLILDFSDPTNPKFLSKYQDMVRPSSWQGIVPVLGSYAYVADEYCGLRIFDVSNPLSIKVESELNLNYVSYGFSVVVDSSYAYLTGNNGLNIIDVSDPLYPVLTSTLNGNFEYIFVKDNMVYLLDKWHLDLSIIDVTNKSNPVILSQYQYENRVSFDDIYGQALYVEGNTAFLLDHRGIVTVDISNPTSQKLTGEYPMLENDSTVFCSYFVFSGDKIYVSAESPGSS